MENKVDVVEQIDLMERMYRRNTRGEGFVMAWICLDLSEIYDMIGKATVYGEPTGNQAIVWVFTEWV